MDLDDLDSLADARRGRWSASGVSCEVTHGPPTDKPAAWLALARGESVGQLIVWVSGEAELEWISGADEGAVHYDLGSTQDLTEAVDDLERALGISETH